MLKCLSSIAKLTLSKAFMKNANGIMIKILAHFPFEKNAIKIAASVKIIPDEDLKKSANWPKTDLKVLRLVGR